MHTEVVESEIRESSDNLLYFYFTQSSGKLVYYGVSQVTVLGIVAAGLLSDTLCDKRISSHKEVILLHDQLGFYVQSHSVLIGELFISVIL